ncbi:hypothetical protein [Agrococcus carbonis]|uniref:Metallopeptidase family protein n=1 Tax=Agrococcus carbonis TaxID=684552 RepID=A0A1H1M5E2_9MICO|nr:hypothetical protein [Agrococcus carbonis]SDR81259.1 hypothetical protein SAMN04489719_0849 [Agrococcus carbonis]
MPARPRSRGSRHGRGIRSSVAGPVLPFLSSRETRFEDIAADAADYVTALWPSELGDVRFQWADMPPRALAGRIDEVPEWAVDPERRVITIFRLPLQRLPRVHIDDPWHRQIAIEGAVFRAAAELIGRDPWEIAPDRWRHH